MDEIEMLKEKVASLEAQLAAATNDAARAELRARDALDYIKRALAEDLLDMGWLERAQPLLAAAPDSDARLREVMRRVVKRTAAEDLDAADADAVVERAIDEVLGPKS